MQIASISLGCFSMKITMRLKKAWLALPAIYGLQPTSDYQSLISHSAKELNAKSWERTGNGIRVAIKAFEERNADVRKSAKRVA